MIRCLQLLSLVCLGAATNILIAGDSWGTEGGSAFNAVMQKHSPSTKVTNIAVGGSTAAQWSRGLKLQRLVNNAKSADYIWLTLGGNDAIGVLPECAKAGKSAQACGDELVEQVTGEMKTIFESVHQANPKVKFIGFGYDIMGMSKLPLCPMAAKNIFPQCEKDANMTFIECWNTQFIRIQQFWETMTKQYSYVNTVSLLGSLQASEHDPKAQIGHPDLAKFSPNDLVEINCIHANSKGFTIIFENLWNLYWSKQPGFGNSSMFVV